MDVIKQNRTKKGIATATTQTTIPANYVRTRNGKLWLSSGYETHKDFTILVAFFHEHCDKSVMAELVATHPNMRFSPQNTTPTGAVQLATIPKSA